MGGPPSKAKYSLATDSEQVPWGKGEKDPCEGSEIEPETMCLQGVGAGFVLWLRAFCLMSLRVSMCGKLKIFWIGGVGKPSPNRAIMSCTC